MEAKHTGLTECSYIEFYFFQFNFWPAIPGLLFQCLCFLWGTCVALSSAASPFEEPCL